MPHYSPASARRIALIAATAAISLATLTACGHHPDGQPPVAKKTQSATPTVTSGTGEDGNPYTATVHPKSPGTQNVTTIVQPGVNCDPSAGISYYYKMPDGSEQLIDVPATFTPDPGHTTHDGGCINGTKQATFNGSGPSSATDQQGNYWMLTYTAAGPASIHTTYLRGTQVDPTWRIKAWAKDGVAIPDPITDTSQHQNIASFAIPVKVADWKNKPIAVQQRTVTTTNDQATVGAWRKFNTFTTDKNGLLWVKVEGGYDTYKAITKQPDSLTTLRVLIPGDTGYDARVIYLNQYSFDQYNYS